MKIIKYKILYSIESLGLGGNQKQLVELIRNFKNEDFLSKVLVFKSGGEREKYLKDIGIEIYYVEKKYQKYIDRIYTLFKIFKEFKPDIILSYDLATAIQICIPAMIGKINHYLVQFGGSYLNSKKIIFFMKLLNRYMEYIICNSEKGALYLNKVCKIPMEKIIIIHNGFDFKIMENPQFKVSNLEEILKQKIKGPIIGSVGKLDENKDPMTFVKAAEIVHKEFPEAIFCIIGDGEYKGMIENYIKEKKMENYFYLIPKRIDAPWLIKDFTIGVLSSKNEGFPNVLLEYMWWEKPIVSTRAGISDFIVENEKTGLIVEIGDFENMSRAILTLLKNREIALNFGLQGKKRLLEKFTIEKNVSQFLELFQKVLN